MIDNYCYCGSSGIVVIFTSVHSVTWEGGGQGLMYAFQKSTLGREGGGHTKKEYSVYALDNVDNSGRPRKVNRVGA